jgi:hypothetical protein
MVMKAEPLHEREYRIVAAGEFKAKCLQMMDDVLANSQLTLVITKRARPVAQLTAPSPGLQLTGPSVLLPTQGPAPASEKGLQAAATATTEEHRHKKHKRKKKHR